METREVMAVNGSYYSPGFGILYFVADNSPVTRLRHRAIRNVLYSRPSSPMWNQPKKRKR